jgi:uncharacterized phage protein gp47/JayE
MYQKSYREILESMRNYIIAHQDKITDFNEGSVILSIIEAIGRELVALYNKCISNVELYSKDMAYAQFDFTKKIGIAASGSVIFSRKASSVLSVNIPAGTIISTRSGLKFITTASGMIATGSKESGLVPASCNEIGDIGNIGINSITTIESSIYGIDYVRNDNAFIGGLNKETDEEYKVRFNEFIIGLGKSSVSGVRSTALSINGVRSVSVVEHFPAEDGYHFTLYAENGSGGLPAVTKASLEAVICGNDTVEGVRACGVNSRVLAPTIVYVNPVILFKVDGSIPAGLIEEQIRNNVTHYVNSLKIGESYEKKLVYNMAIKQMGLVDINTITPATTTITKRQIIRLGTLRVEGV